MSRTSLVTTGVLAILFGIQLNMVDSFVLTPRATKFWQSRLNNPVFRTQPLQNTVAGIPNLNGQNVNGYLPNRPLPNTNLPNANQPYAQRPAIGGQQYGSQQYQQYSRSYARNNYPFNTPNYSGRTGLPSFNRQGYSGATNALPAGYTSANPLNRYANTGLLGPQKTVTPPKWISWASIFLGAVLFIYGAAMGRD